MRHKSGRSDSGPPIYFSLIWLSYLLFPLFYSFDYAVTDMTACALLVVLLAVSYIYGFRHYQFRLTAILLQMLIMLLFCTVFHINITYIAFYPAPLIGFLQAKRLIVACTLLLIGLLVFNGWYNELAADHNTVVQVLPSLLIMLLIPITIRVGHHAQEMKERLYRAENEIARMSHNEERQHDASNLHSSLGHTLSLITLKSELAEKLIVRSTDRAAQELRDIQSISRTALNQVRKLVTEMQAVTVHEEMVQAKQMLAAAGIELQVQGTFPAAAASPLTDNILGLCLRETIANVVMHSQATRCVVQWEEQTDIILLSITDNGVGMETEIEQKWLTGNGLRGMKERLKFIDGTLQVESAQGKGTTAAFSIPRLHKSAEPRK